MGEQEQAGLAGVPGSLAQLALQHHAAAQAGVRDIPQPHHMAHAGLAAGQPLPAGAPRLPLCEPMVRDVRVAFMGCACLESPCQIVHIAAWPCWQDGSSRMQSEGMVAWQKETV